MGRHGPIPKDPRTRQRTNRPEETIKLPTMAEAALFPVPEMPPRPEGKQKRWASIVAEWWKSAWTSPMSKMWTGAEAKTTLYDILRLRQFAAESRDPREFASLLKTIRSYEMLLGFTAMDRLRLRWEIPPDPQPEPDPEPEEKPSEPEPVVAEVPGFKDPRDALGSSSSNGAPPG